MYAKLAVSFVFVTTFLLISIVSGDSFGRAAPAMGEEPEPPTYTITMDYTNAPTTSETYISVEADIRYSHFEYVDARASATNHVELNTGGTIKNAIDSRITSILSVTAFFSTSGSLSLGTSYYGATFTTVTLTSGVVHDLSTELPYYVKLTSVDAVATITNVTIVYSCIPNEEILEAGDNYYLGSYPQTKVTDSELITDLNTAGGTLPTSDNSQTWTSYGFYISRSNTTNFMWYKDVTSGDDKYRGVYFTSYRPYYTEYSSSASYSLQDDNGYLINTRYWFKYEPITWDVLSVGETGGPLVVADMILDSRDYYHLTSSRTISGVTVYANNYKESNVRGWLNSDFYNQAFSSNEQSSINTTTVDNSTASTGTTPNIYACADTNDEMFLLSYVEATNTSYGFSTTTSRIRQATDYAKALGVYVSYVNSRWWLRSPYYYFNSINARDVYYDGHIISSNNVYFTGNGVLPAFRINR
jgi:hypothetical protein